MGKSACVCQQEPSNEINFNLLPIEEQIKAASYVRVVTEPNNNNYSRTMDQLDIKSFLSVLLVDLSKL